MVIRGLRGVGKTVLLNTFEDHAESDGFLTYYHDLTLTAASSPRSPATRRPRSGLKLSARAMSAIREALGHLGTSKWSGRKASSSQSTCGKPTRARSPGTSPSCSYN
jgi:hypothetical protein